MSEKRQQPAVISDMQRFLLWLIPTVEKFPRSQRFVLGDRIENLALDIFELLLEASYLRRNRQVLMTANLKLEKLRHLLRLSVDLKIITVKKLEYAIQCLYAIGCQIGGWLRSSR